MFALRLGFMAMRRRLICLHSSKDNNCFIVLSFFYFNITSGRIRKPAKGELRVNNLVYSETQGGAIINLPKLIIRREKNSLLLTGWENKEQEQFKENSKYAEGSCQETVPGQHTAYCVVFVSTCQRTPLFQPKKRCKGNKKESNSIIIPLPADGV